MTTRVYVPATLDLLATWHRDGVVPATVERYVAEEESEEAEHEALLEAADASADLLEGPGRRVVVVADAAHADAEMPLRDLAAVHADTEDLDPEHAHDAPAPAWFGVQEIPDLLQG